MHCCPGGTVGLFYLPELLIEFELQALYYVGDKLGFYYYVNVFSSVL